MISSAFLWGGLNKLSTHHQMPVWMEWGKILRKPAALLNFKLCNRHCITQGKATGWATVSGVLRLWEGLKGEGKEEGKEEDKNWNCYGKHKWEYNYRNSVPIVKYHVTLQIDTHNTAGNSRATCYMLLTWMCLAMESSLIYTCSSSWRASSEQTSAIMPKILGTLPLSWPRMTELLLCVCVSVGGRRRFEVWRDGGGRQREREIEYQN